MFGVVLGLLAWFYLQAQITLYVVELDVVRARRLWPRSLVPPPLTEADLRAYQMYAEAGLLRPELAVEVWQAAARHRGRAAHSAVGCQWAQASQPGSLHAAVLKSAKSERRDLGAAGRRQPARADGRREPGRGVHLRPVGLGVRAAGRGGFEPLGFVVGSSIYHVGLQVGRWSQNQELQVLTQAMYNARELAMARMRAEADHLAADGIVGVQLRMQMYAWGQGCLEFVATGTAVRHLAGTGAHRAPDGRAFTSDLSAQDFFRLLAAGAVPVAFVLGTCVYHIAHQGVMQSLRQTGQNQEMVQFTQGVYEARELALERMQAEATQAQSSGIVGVTVEVKNHVWGEHATEFLATGTAIRRLADEHRLPETSPKPTFTLGLDS